MITPNRERRDWTLLVFIIPIGVILMLIAGQVAVRLVPEWSVNAGMQSNLDPNNLPMQQSGPVQPVLPAILTPLGWLDTFLTPGAGSGDQIVFPPFIVFEPSATLVVTNPPPTVATTQPSPTVPTATDSPTIVVPPPTGTKPPVDETSTPPTSTPPTSTPPTSTPPTPTPPTPTSTPSTPPPLYIKVSPPADLGTSTPDGIPGNILPGTYTIVDISGNPVFVSNAPDGNYDLIFYEADFGLGTIYLDNIIIGISNVTDGSYYTVFNWGDNDLVDTNQNTNVNTTVLDITYPDPTCTGAAAPECDNRGIPGTALYTDSGISTGILIDVDTAPSAPPEGTYSYLVIVSPLSGDLDSVNVDSIVVDEVPIPVSLAAPLNKVPDESANGESSISVDEALSPPGKDTSPSADENPSTLNQDAFPSEDGAPALPAEEASSTP
jgi:hypothetical protein